VLWQDRPGLTTPVTAIGQPIGAYRDPFSGVRLMFAEADDRRPAWGGPGVGAIFTSNLHMLFTTFCPDASATESVTDIISCKAYPGGTPSMRLLDSQASGASKGVRVIQRGGTAMRNIHACSDSVNADHLATPIIPIGQSVICASVYNRDRARSEWWLNGSLQSTLASTLTGTIGNFYIRLSGLNNINPWNGEIRYWAAYVGAPVPDETLASLTGSV
jgi:hypothetical protein